MGRCDDGYDETMPCQCNDKCEQYNNCCADKEEVCGHDGTVTDDDLKSISEELMKLDDNIKICLWHQEYQIRKLKYLNQFCQNVLVTYYRNFENFADVS